MQPGKFLPKLSAALVFCTASSFLLAADVDCTGCHDSAPVSADHMEMDEVSVEACTMCHAAESDDPFFRTVHEQHGEDLGCDTCHGEASDERKAKLKSILGG